MQKITLKLSVKYLKLKFTWCYKCFDLIKYDQLIKFFPSIDQSKASKYL